MDNLERIYKFEYDPNVIKMLGENLYSTVHAALSELVANAFDASANNVWITITNDFIRVEDDGKGMDYSAMQDNFLRIAYDSREIHGDFIIRTKKKYLRMGRKGVGKLAALSLGKVAKFYSKTISDISGCMISLDSNENIVALPNSEMVFYNTSNLKSGTIAEISSLRKKVLLQKNRTIRELQKRFYRKNVVDFNVYIRTSQEEGFSEPIPWNIDYFRYLDILFVFDKRTLSTITTNNEITHIAFKEKITNAKRDIFTLYPNEIDRISQNIKEKLESIEILKVDFDFSNEISVSYTHESGNDCLLIFSGWIGTYKTLIEDEYDKTFNPLTLQGPDNSVYIYSRGKLGLANALNKINTKQVFETYMVGEINIDGLEDSSLPDIATSNRQNYNEEDSRITIMNEVLKVLKNKLIDYKKDKGNIDPDKDSLEAVKPVTELGVNMQKAYQEELGKYSGEERKKKSTQFADVCYRMDLVLQKEDKYGQDIIFISHSRIDYPSYAIMREVLLVAFSNIDENNVFCSTIDEPPIYNNMFDVIAQKLLHSISIIYMFSKHFQVSMFTQQEVGAGWILGKRYNRKYYIQI